MKPEKQKALNNAYDRFMDLILGDLPLDSINDLAVENVTGYGSTVDEKINDINRLRQLVIDQREQGVGVDISLDKKTVQRRVSPKGDAAIFIDEIEVTIQTDKEKNVMTLRLSTIFEYIEERWKVVHMHGSTGVETEGDTWHLDEWKKKMEELQKLVDEKTAELLIKNRELEIEAALERVRARTMAMHKSEELQEVAVLLYKEFQALGVTPFLNCGYVEVDEGNNIQHAWMTSPDGNFMGRFNLPLTGEPAFQNRFDAWKNKEPIFHQVVGGSDLIKHIEIASPHFGSGQVNDVVKNQFPDPTIFYCGNFSQGYLHLISGTPLTSEEESLLTRFTGAFEMAYKRFLDLQKAEAQAREAQIEAALERVRSKAMSMQKSDDLSQAVKIIFDELDKLNLGMLRCGIGILNKENRSAELWTTTITEGKNTVQVSGDESIDIHPLLHGAFEAWLNQKDFSYVLEGEDLNNYYKSLLGVNFKLPESQSKISAEEGLKQFYFVATFGAGGLFVFRDSPFPDESRKIIKRFADVFNLTYTRFNDLLQAEAQNKIIQADNKRKTQELEEARQLQLAMLPKEIPEHPGLDIKVYMQTATEVGGDYYDFSVKEDGSINIAIGDATGHGMKAGTLVTMIKSLFTANSENKTIEEFFKSSNDAIKNSNLKRMMIGFAMLNISDHKTKFINAGMPPVYHYIKSKEIIEEIKQHNLPLGAIKLEKYNSTDIILSTGDVLLMMSDGYPELHNPDDELFGYEKVYSSFKRVTEKEPEEIIKYLNEEGSRWTKGKELQDDITFVVVKIK